MTVRERLEAALNVAISTLNQVPRTTIRAYPVKADTHYM